MVKNSQDIKMF